MHQSSMTRMEEFVDTYLDKETELKILDVGSGCKHSNQSTYKTFFNCGA